MQKTDIVPFDSFWLNCDFNANFSIITSIESSYYDLALLNCYSYVQCHIETPNGTGVSYLMLQNSDTQFTLMEDCVKRIPIKVRGSVDMVDNLSHLLKNHTLLIGVDLYHWIPRSLCWQKHHWEHYSIVQSYDEARKVFTVLDENLQGYGVHEIPAERFVEAVESSPLEEDGYIICFRGELEKYTLYQEEVKVNAERLKNDLSSFVGEEVFFWKLSEKDIREGHMLDLFSMYVHQISNRQIGNVKLMNRLHELNAISSEEHISMVELFMKLKNGWEMVKSHFIFSERSRTRGLDIARINELKKQLIQDEINAWDNFQKH